MSRPKTLDDHKKTEICAMLTAGMSLTRVARHAGCDRRAIHRERQRDPEFGERVRRARLAADLGPHAAMRRFATTHWRAAAWMIDRQERLEKERRAEKYYTQTDVDNLAEWVKRIVKLNLVLDPMDGPTVADQVDDVFRQAAPGKTQPPERGQGRKRPTVAESIRFLEKRAAERAAAAQDENPEDEQPDPVAAPSPDSPDVRPFPDRPTEDPVVGRSPDRPTRLTEGLQRQAETSGPPSGLVGRPAHNNVGRPAHNDNGKPAHNDNGRPAHNDNGRPAHNSAPNQPAAPPDDTPARGDARGAFPPTRDPNVPEPGTNPAPDSPSEAQKTLQIPSKTGPPAGDANVPGDRVSGTGTLESRLQPARDDTPFAKREQRQNMPSSNQEQPSRPADPSAHAQPAARCGHDTQPVVGRSPDRPTRPTEGLHPQEVTAGHPSG